MEKERTRMARQQPARRLFFPFNPLQFGITAAGPECYIDILVQKRQNFPVGEVINHGKLPTHSPSLCNLKNFEVFVHGTQRLDQRNT